MKEVVFDLLRFYRAKRLKLSFAYDGYLAKKIKVERAGFFKNYTSGIDNNMLSGLAQGEFLGKKFLLNCKLNDEIESRLLISKVWDKELLDFATAILQKRKGAFFDVGGNVGAVTIPLAVNFPGHSFYVFEPHSAIAGRLMDNIRLNLLQNVRVVQNAVSEVEGEVAFYAQAQNDNMGLSSIVESAVTTGNEKTVVKAITLDSFASANSIQEIAFIKIDIQGAEIFALRGMRNILQNSRPVVVFEHEDSLHGSTAPSLRREIAEIMRQASYKLFALNPVLLAEFGFLPQLDLKAEYEGNVLAIPD